MDGVGAVEIAGVPVHSISCSDAAEMLIDAAVARRSLVVHLCNAYVLSLAARDPRYAALLASGDVNLADGAPVAWTLRRLGVPINGDRPSGGELVEATMARSLGTGVGHYLYGSSPEVVSSMAANLRAQHPGLRIVAAESPPYRPLDPQEHRELVGRIRAAGAGIVWVGTGTPKQDELVERLREDIDAVLVPVGAAFDFIAGVKRRAPAWMRRAGMEWVYRLVSEPRRLWRRYLLGNLIFLAAAMRAKALG